MAQATLEFSSLVGNKKYLTSKEAQIAEDRGTVIFFRQLGGATRSFMHSSPSKQLTETQVLERIVEMGFAGDNEQAKEVLGSIENKWFSYPGVHLFPLSTVISASLCRVATKEGGEQRYKVRYNAFTI